MIRADFSHPSMMNNLEKYKKLGWNIDKLTLKGYRIISRQSRDIEFQNLHEYHDGVIMEIPCGQCLECRLDYARDWATRCWCESRYYSDNYFITLTYDDDNVPVGKYGNLTIKNDDLLEFIDKVRKHFRKLGHIGIRYFACSEYGDHTMRPHYHLILFNCPLHDLSPDIETPDGCIIHKCNNLGDIYYQSKVLSRLWNKGMVLVGDCTYNTNAYVSRYICKKQKGASSSVYDSLGVEPPKLFMSRMPGIGERYFNDHYDELLDIPYIYISKGSEVIKSPIPRYFVKLLKKHHFNDYLSFIDRHVVDDVIKARTLYCDDEYFRNINDNRVAKESNLISRMNAFSRDI